MNHFEADKLCAVLQDLATGDTALIAARTTSDAIHRMGQRHLKGDPSPPPNLLIDEGLNKIIIKSLNAAKLVCIATEFYDATEKVNSILNRLTNLEQKQDYSSVYVELIGNNILAKIA